MRLSFKVFGFEVASLDLELPESDSPLPVAIAEPVVGIFTKGAKWMSHQWVKAMMK